jgi:hypothetical protein
LLAFGAGVERAADGEQLDHPFIGDGIGTQRDIVVEQRKDIAGPARTPALLAVRHLEFVPAAGEERDVAVPAVALQ